jgi:FkbM family methyltransferase
MKILFLLTKKIKFILPYKIKTLVKKLRKFNGDGLDKKMLDYINYKNGFFIECGANDGINQSTTWYFEKKLKWKGLLIEPTKEIYKDLKKNRSEKNFFFNTALRSFKYKSKKLTLYFNKNDFLTTRSTLDKEKREEIIVNCDNLTNILDKINAPKFIDFFVLDVEGDEKEVLNGINFEKYKFKFFLIETGEFDEVKKILLKNNYIFIKKLYKGNVYSDYLFKFKN